MFKHGAHIDAGGGDLMGIALRLLLARPASFFCRPVSELTWDSAALGRLTSAMPLATESLNPPPPPTSAGPQEVTLLLGASLIVFVFTHWLASPQIIDAGQTVYFWEMCGAPAVTAAEAM